MSTKEELIKAAVEGLEEEARLSKRDAEGPHEQADAILCQLLIALGYREVIEAYDKVTKWYS